MKTRINTLLVISMFAGSLVFTGSGCSKKELYNPDIDSDTTMSGGKTINYPAAQNKGFSEEELPLEGTLDDTAATPVTAGVNPAETTDEYKRAHGRSSQGLSPIYFDFDQASIRTDMADRMVSNAAFLQQNPGIKVLVEGNTDERGTSEYNVALAQRRAYNTQQYLIDLGVNPKRVRTISYGEEKPLFIGQDEETYAQNRRADFVVE